MYQTREVVLADAMLPEKEDREIGGSQASGPPQDLAHCGRAYHRQSVGVWRLLVGSPQPAVDLDDFFSLSEGRGF